MKKVRYKKSIVFGFLVLYLTSMCFSTLVVKESFEEKYRNSFESFGTKIRMELNNINVSNLEDQYFKNVVSYLITSELNPNHGYYGGNGDNEKYQQMSCTVYNKKTGEKIAQSGVLVTDGLSYTAKHEMVCTAYNIQGILSIEELNRVVEYKAEMEEIFRKQTYPKYLYNMLVDVESGELLQLDFIEKIWDTSLDGGIYTWNKSEVKDIELLLRWQNPNVNSEDRETTWASYAVAEYDFPIIVPYLHRGFEAWEQWYDNSFLQGFPERFGRNSKAIERDYLGNINEEMEYELHLGDDTYYCVLVRQTSNPWLAAVDYMKYVYLVGFILMLACMLKVLYTTEKTYRERAKLEETRRDFTNAIAHELKTPLGVIRGFSENLKENTNEDKREYYLDQIVGQTERMDEMVKEMIYISKLDSDKFVLDKKEVSIKELIEEALESLSIYIEEKHLQISYEGLSDKVIQGDSQYLKKAIWNLVSNAVEYNRQNGRVEIIFEESAVKIRNTGNQIPEEDLPYVFDMFYTGNKSRTSGESHLGLGLYLAKKIFDLHGLRVSIGNIEDGVDVTITR